jgi:hypothetical protein
MPKQRIKYSRKSKQAILRETKNPRSTSSFPSSFLCCFFFLFNGAWMGRLPSKNYMSTEVPLWKRTYEQYIREESGWRLNHLELLVD